MQTEEAELISSLDLLRQKGNSRKAEADDAKSQIQNGPGKAHKINHKKRQGITLGKKTQKVG